MTRPIPRDYLGVPITPDAESDYRTREPDIAITDLDGHYGNLSPTRDVPFSRDGLGEDDYADTTNPSASVDRHIVGGTWAPADPYTDHTGPAPFGA